MKKQIKVLLTAVAFLLSVAGSLGAQTPQQLLPGALIPQFVDRCRLRGRFRL